MEKGISPYEPSNELFKGFDWPIKSCSSESESTMSSKRYGSPNKGDLCHGYDELATYTICSTIALIWGSNASSSSFQNIKYCNYIAPQKRILRKGLSTITFFAVNNMLAINMPKINHLPNADSNSLKLI